MRARPLGRRLSNDPQSDLFRASLPPPVPIPPVRDRLSIARLPTAQRAGTRIDHAPGNAVEIYAHGPKRLALASVGWIDRRQRVYQSGGEYEGFWFRKLNALSFQGEVWEQLTTTWCDAIDVVELVDNPANRVYRVPFAVAIAEGEWYDAGIGQRWGVPLELWDVEPFQTYDEKGDETDDENRTAGSTARANGNNTRGTRRSPHGR